MYSTEQVRGLLREQKNICANILIDKNDSANVGDMWDAPEPTLTPDGIKSPLPDNCIISPQYDRHGYLNGGYVVKGGIIRGHIDQRGEAGAEGCVGVRVEPPDKLENIKDVEIYNPKYEKRGNASFLIGGDIVFKNGMKIGEVNKDNNISIGYYGTKGCE